jgi:hypothetical protein
MHTKFKKKIDGNTKLRHARYGYQDNIKTDLNPLQSEIHRNNRA